MDQQGSTVERRRFLVKYGKQNIRRFRPKASPTRNRVLIVSCVVWRPTIWSFGKAIKPNKFRFI